MKQISFLSALLMSGVMVCSCSENMEETGNSNVIGAPVKHQIEITTLPIEGIVASSTTRAAEPDEMVTLSYDNVTRATTDKSEDESKINRLYILQFAGVDGASKLLKVSSDLTAEFAKNGKIDYEFATNNAVQRVYVVANMDVSSYKVDATTLKDFEEETIAFTPVTSVPAGGLLMAAVQNFNPLADAPATFNLKTPLAKLTFGCDFLLQGGAPKSIVLKNIPNGYQVKDISLSASDVSQQPASGVTYEGTLDLALSITNPVTYYLPANLAGRNRSLEKSVHRNAFFAPENAMYVEIEGYAVVDMASYKYRYYLALGDGTPQDFNVAANSAYTVTATLKGVKDAADLRVGSDIVDLNAQLGGKTANCYIIVEEKDIFTQRDDRRFAIDPTVMGNGATTPAHTKSSVVNDAAFPAIVPVPLAPKSAAVLWQTNNSSTYSGPIVSSAILAGGKLIIKSSTNNGNAVVAVYDNEDASGDVLWSWHIWKVTKDPTATPVTLADINSTSGNFVATGSTTLSGIKMMDRNLGAMTTKATQIDDNGLYYQWGRKDPFPAGEGMFGAVSQPLPEAVAGPVTPADAVKNPTVFYSGQDWTTRNDNLWGTPATGVVTVGDKGNSGANTNVFNSNNGSKSIYDPCPVGWRVAPAYVYANLKEGDAAAADMNFGSSFGSPGFTTSGSLWFSYAGCLAASSKKFERVNQFGFNWTSSPGIQSSVNSIYADYGNAMEVSAGHLFNTFARNERAKGASVRCIME